MTKAKQFLKIRMEPIKRLKRYLKVIGIVLAESSSLEKQSEIFKNCFSITVCASAVVATGWYRLFDAHSTREMTESNGFTLGFLLSLVWNSTLIWQRKNYAAIIAELTEKIVQSKCNRIINVVDPAFKRKLN